MSTSQKPISWSACGQVCYIDGKAYGLTDKLRRICLGEELEVKKKLAQGKTALELVAETVSDALQRTTGGLDSSRPIQLKGEEK